MKTKEQFVQAMMAKLEADGFPLRSKAEGNRVFDAFMGTLEDCIVNDGGMSFIGFGSFSVVERAARSGRNIQTGEPMEIPAKKAVKFHAGKRLADTVANG